MTDEQIIKALEYCSKQGVTSECERCKVPKGCRPYLISKAIDLINRQKAEIKVKNKLLDIAEKKFKKYDAEIEELAYKLGSLLCHATGSKLSKHTYPLHIMESYVNDTIQDYCEEAEAEAIKEFAERLQNCWYDLPTLSDDDGEYDYVCIEALDEFIDNYVKEKVGNDESTKNS